MVRHTPQALANPESEAQYLTGNPPHMFAVCTVGLCTGR
jgi:hypothetical protein